MIKFSKKNLAFILLFTLILGLFLVNANEAKASIAGVLGATAKDVLQGVFYVLLRLAQLFTGLVTKIFTAILDFGFQKMNMVYLGWTITRDIVNMLFILGLIVIAFATILRIETYGMKALLVKLILVALLINFSYLACGIIIDASQILANYFIGQIKTKDVGLAVLDTLKVQTALTPEQGVTVPITSSDPEVTLILNTAFSAAIIFVAGFVLLIGAILLFLRIGALWALIILAPFAWFFSIFPALKSHADKWWSEFFKWSFFAPIYVFFIYLVLKIARETSILSLGKDSQTGMSMTGMMSDLHLLSYFVFLVVLLCGAPTLAMSLGIKAAGTVTAFAKGALKGTAKLPIKLQKVAAGMAPPAWMEKGLPPLATLVRGIQKTAAYTSPELWKKAWEARKAERQRKARLGYIIGKQQDVLNRVFSLWSEKTNFAEQAEQFEIIERKKEIEAETKRVGSRLVAKMKEAQKRKQAGVVDYKSCVELLQEQGDTNDAMIFSDMFDEFKYDDKYALGKYRGKGIYVNDPTNRRFTNLGFKHGVIGQMRQMGLSDKQIAPFLGKLQEIALGAGYYGMYGMVDTDEKGNTVIATDENQIKVATAKVKVLTGRARTSKLHAGALVAQGADEKGQYKFAGRDDVGDSILGIFTPTDVAETSMQYIRPDTRTVVEQAYTAGALKEISTAADALGKKFHEAITEVKKETKEVKKEIKKTKEEVEKK